MIRVEEAMREAVVLGFDSNIVHLLDQRNWFLQHRTPAGYMNADCTLRDVNGFKPGPIDEHAIAEIRDIIGSGIRVIRAVPDPNDRLAMHRITTRVVTENRGNAGLLTYECLSTIDEHPTPSKVLRPDSRALRGNACKWCYIHLGGRSRSTCRRA
jgi:hypothetical protein